jgi:hypothetical protein
MLPLLLTAKWRIDDRGNPDGSLGPVWREPDRDFDDRRLWLPDLGCRDLLEGTSPWQVTRRLYWTGG